MIVLFIGMIGLIPWQLSVGAKRDIIAAVVINARKPVFANKDKPKVYT